jgi:hypothetical protein
MGRDPESKLKEAILMLDVLALIERWVDDLDAARDSLAEDKIMDLKGLATELVDYRRQEGLPEYAQMLAQAHDASEDYAVSPMARRRQFRLVNGEKNDESTEEAVSGDQQEDGGRREAVRPDLQEAGRGEGEGRQPQ